MKKIIALTDYKGIFGSKWGTVPYRSGFDKIIMKQSFEKQGYEIEFIKFNDVKFNKDFWNGKYVIYTSSEEVGLKYKDYIEDVIYGIELSGGIVIPNYSYLRANNNKVFMEILRKNKLRDQENVLNSTIYGAYEELQEDIANNKIDYPIVIKKSAGAMSRGVYLAKNESELIKYAKKCSRTKNILAEMKELIRLKKYPGYKAESKYQNKFITQSFIPGLKNDWKILVYWDKFFVLKRYNRLNDFRASGSGKFQYDKDFPQELIVYSDKIRKICDVPNISLDVCYDEKFFYLLEYQAIYFGTRTLINAPYYFKISKNDKVSCVKESAILEEVYAYSVVNFINNKK